jgi:thiamine biosynthesis protein ThiI
MYHTLVINVDELFLKGKNRPFYYRSLREHTRELLDAYHQEPFTCVNEEQRLVARSESPFSEETIRVFLNVPGVHSIIPARRIPVDFQQVFPTVKEELQRWEDLPATFKVVTRRSYKGFPLNSLEVCKAIGALVLKEFPRLAVDVKNPGLVIEIRILQNNIYVSTRKLPGIGGLPVGTSGHLVTLISGGFDSPVASFLMAKRGCRQTFIFFYAYPFVGDEVKDKVLKLVQILGRYQRHSRLYIVPFGHVQDLIAKNCREDYRTLLFRKAMLQCSTLLARKVKAGALLTGDALGQVSSQAIGNISVLDKVSPLPVFRPLLGYNKIEILALAKKIGTHDISVIPHDDACSLFAPKHPVIRPSASYLEKFDHMVQLEEPLIKCLQEADVYEISLTGGLTPAETMNREDVQK